MTIQANFPNVQPSLLLDFANAKQLPPSVTFTRATTAAYYDGNTTAMAEQNLLQYSQAMNTSPWDTVVASVTQASGTAPDGTTTANTITQTSTGTARARQTQVFQNEAIHTYSAYIKAGTAGYAAIAYSESSWECYVKVNMSTGAIQEAGNFSGRSTYVSSSITSVGNGWYRVSLVFTAFQGASTDYIHIIVTDSTSWSGQTSPASTTSVGTVLAWGAQVEQRSSATAYTATTSQPITNYIPVLLTAGGGQPRFDHNPTTSESLGLLIEEQRTNLVNYSRTIAANWNTQGCSVSATAVAPDGTLTGTVIQEDTTAGIRHGVYTNGVGAYSTSATTWSVYAKAGVRDKIVFVAYNSGWSVSSSAISITSGTPVGNGWYRITWTTTPTSSAGTAYLEIWPADATGDIYYTGSGWNALSIWGAQAEVGSFATSFIPTSGAAATRAADVVSMSGANFSSWYSPGNGTLYAEASTASVAGDVMIAEGTNSSNGYLDFSLTFATTGTQFINRFVATNNDMRRSNVVAVNTMVKFSGSITNSSGTSVASVSGLTVSSAGSQGANFGADRMFIGSRGGSSLFINAPIKKFAFYPAQLTQTQQNSITG